jgi:hypothetical protein
MTKIVSIDIIASENNSPWVYAMSADASDSLSDEIEAAFLRAGVAIPADLKAGAISEARNLARATSLLRRPRAAASEPSNLFSLVKFA